LKLYAIALIRKSYWNFTFTIVNW